MYSIVTQDDRSSKLILSVHKYSMYTDCHKNIADLYNIIIIMYNERLISCDLIVTLNSFLIHESLNCLWFNTSYQYNIRY